MTRMDETTHVVLKLFTTVLAVINALLLMELALSKRRVSKWQIAAIVISIMSFLIIWYLAVGQFQADDLNQTDGPALPLAVPR